jgi:SPP1 family predicted phage head-tail adaptor
MIAYKLRNRIDIQELNYAIDSNTGARIESWVSILNKLEPASITPMSGKEFIAAQSIQSGISTRIVIRKIDGIRPSMRIVHQGVYYNILAILPDSTLTDYLTFLCDSGFNDG